MKLCRYVVKTVYVLQIEKVVVRVESRCENDQQLSTVKQGSFPPSLQPLKSKGLDVRPCKPLNQSGFKLTDHISLAWSF